MLSEADIEKAVRLGEDATVEFKDVARSSFRADADDLAKAIASLANTRGGHVILGISDDGTPTGVGTLKQADALMRQVSQACQDRIRPALSCVTAKVEFRKVPLIVVEVAAFSPDRPHLVDGLCYIRDANQSRKATREEQIRILQSADYHFDEQPVEGAKLEDLDLLAVQAFLSAEQSTPPPDGELQRYLRALKALDEALDDSARPTVSGILFFGKEPNRWLPDARISAVRFKGNEMSGEFLDRKEITSRFPDQMNAAIAFLATHVLAPARVEGFDRVEKGIPAEVLREALVNAMIHRDYRVSSQVRLFVFDDRVEFINPGVLLNQLTLDNIRTGGISQRRNPVICSLSARLGRRELYGMGIPVMIRMMRERGLPEPDFSEEGSHFRVVLRRQPVRAT
ncbi:MAG: hypothetical protein FJ272_08195 [Planctomycetes bacterium]|nr:hypothetical protein [Planctomycetota bacterium]